MPDTNKKLNTAGVQMPRILLPDGVDLKKWAVVACDQYTSEPGYWQEVEALVGDAPSTLKMTLPEIYLEDADVGLRVAHINADMSAYLNGSILKPLEPGFVLTVRDTPHVKGRRGLILSIDLERYDYRKGSASLIRATEGTIVERLPPRMRIRRNAPVELPHILLLIDDPDKTVIEPIAAAMEGRPPLYDFDLMMDSGHIRGYAVNDGEIIDKMADALIKLKDRAPGGLLFAVGDGNHSLATAKACWEELKHSLSGEAQINHPARFALVELMNVHDEAIAFEPIHRVLFADSNDGAIDALKAAARNLSCSFETSKAPLNGFHNIQMHTSGGMAFACLPLDMHELPVGALQLVIDRALNLNEGLRVDYIHGADVVGMLTAKPGNIGFMLETIDKKLLFKTVANRGALPRKTFSMGEACEKRFYLEARRIQP